MLSRLAAEMAAEIRQHDWSDAPFRADRAGHDRKTDTNRGTDVLSAVETENVKINAVWVTAQVLGYNDPAFDVLEYAAACGIVNIRTGGWIRAGVRMSNGRFDPPGTLARAHELLPLCHVCQTGIEPDRKGQVRRESVSTDDNRLVWGPVWVHQECRTLVRTPYDHKIGDGFSATCELVDLI